MDPARKRTIRLGCALGAAVLLAVALVYTSFTASSQARTPSQLLASAQPGQAYQLTGTVTNGSIRRSGDQTSFRVQDRGGHASIPVVYTGAVPDPFRDGREIIVTVTRQGDQFIGQRDSLVTKCPSKFATAPPKST